MDSIGPQPDALIQALDVDSAHRVLEIGPRAGSATAMLADRVGTRGKVVTVETDSALQAGSVHQFAHYDQVRCVAGDATPSYGNFDRVMTTVAVPLRHVPPEWMSLCRAGGVIVAPIYVGLDVTPVVRFVVDQDGSATGHALQIPLSEFTPNRVHPVANLDINIEETFRNVDQREGFASSDPNPLQAWENLACRLTMAIALPSVNGGITLPADGLSHARMWLHDPVSGAAAVARRLPITADRYWVHQHGMRRLWDEAEAAIAWWQGHYNPRAVDWLWTITPRQTIRLTPENSR